MTGHLYFLILGYNCVNHSIACLESIIEHEQEPEILFLDNGSSDHTYDILKNKFKGYEKIKNFYSPKNLGVSAGRNFLLTKVKDKDSYLIFIDNDTILLDQVSHKVIIGLNNQIVGVYGKTGIFFSDNLDPFVTKEIRQEVDAVTGYFLASRYRILQQVGFFDNNYFFYEDDFDLCLKIKENNYKIMSDDTIPVLHKEHISSSTLKDKDLYLKKNRQYFIRHWKNKQAILEINKRNLNYLDCRNCTEIWTRKT